MTEVAFHFNVADRLDYACRLLRKACARGAKVVVTGDPAQLRELDTALWTFSQLEFIPHGYVPACGDAVAQASPVLLADALDGLPHREVLVNLGRPVPAGFEQYERLIEVVSTDPEDRQQARQRWRHYAERGYAIVRHDQAGKAEQGGA